MSYEGGDEDKKEAVKRRREGRHGELRGGVRGEGEGSGGKRREEEGGGWRRRRRRKRRVSRRRKQRSRMKRRIFNERGKKEKTRGRKI